MSAPNTNIETQEHEHKTPLFGIKAALVYAAILLAAFVTYVVYQGGEESTAPADVGTSVLENYDGGNYAPGGNATGSVSGTPDN